jgi:hypothetical protein
MKHAFGCLTAIFFLVSIAGEWKDNDDRLEAKVDVLPKLSGREGKVATADLDRRYMRVGGHAQPHGHAI